VQLVNIVATVTDERGRYVSDLTPDDFIVKEDGQIQKISNLRQSQDLPVSVGIVLDSSASMDRKITTAATAVERFIRRILDDDDIFLMTFANRPTLVQDFTNDRNRLAGALRRVAVGGETALYDALVDSLRHIKGGLHTRKAILLITDGEDTASYINLDQASLAVRESEILVYGLGISASPEGPLSGPANRIPSSPPVIINDPSGRRPPTIGLPGGITIPIPMPGVPSNPGGPQFPGGRGTPPGQRIPLTTQFQRQRLPGGTTITLSDGVDMNVLDAFADASGGKAFLLTGSWADSRGGEINNVLDEIAAELRNQYSIDYYPSHPIKDGKWHTIQVTAKNKNYHVRARKQYFGG
jgi:VWFA-related protein